MIIHKSVSTSIGAGSGFLEPAGEIVALETNIEVTNTPAISRSYALSLMSLLEAINLSSFKKVATRAISTLLTVRQSIFGRNNDTCDPAFKPRGTLAFRPFTSFESVDLPNPDFGNSEQEVFGDLSITQNAFGESLVGRKSGSLEKSFDLVFSKLTLQQVNDFLQMYENNIGEPITYIDYNSREFEVLILTRPLIQETPTGYSMSVRLEI